jgi:hypothetical protein
VLAFAAAFSGCGTQNSSGSGSNQGGSLTIGNQTLSFGTVVIGANNTLSDTVTNTSTSSVTVTSASSSDPSFQLVSPTLPVTIGAGQSTNVVVSFTPGAVGNPSGSVTLSTANGTAKINVNGNGVNAGSIVPSSKSLSFGNVTVGKSQSQNVTLGNPGGSSVTILQASVSSSSFTLSGLTLPVTLAPGQSVPATINFIPTATGVVNGSISLSGSASLSTKQGASSSKAASSSITVSGDGVQAGNVVLSPGSFDFPNVQVGKSQTIAAALTNTGGSSATISAATVSGAGFSLSGISVPLTLAPGQVANFSVVFTPASAGSATGTLSVTSSTNSGALTAALAGTGVTAGTLSLSPSSLTFGNVPVGSSKSLQETVTNTGGTSVSLTAVTASGTGYSVTGITPPVQIAPGASVSFNVVFAPTSTGSSNGTIAITSNASNANLGLGLSGTGDTAGQLSGNPSSLSFGNVTTGTSKSLSETVTNTGGTSVSLTGASATGTGFSISGLTTPTQLAAGQSVTFNVIFAPTSAGNVSGSVNITSNATNSNLALALSANGVTPGQLSASPTSQAFGTVTVGSNKSLSQTVTNVGGTSVTISQGSASGAGFSISGLSASTVLAPGQSTSFTVTFAPTTAGAATGSVTVSSNASNPSLAIGLSGTGAAAGLLSASPTSLSFGSVAVGSSQTLSETVTNSGGTAVNISAASASGSGFSISGIATPLQLTAGQSLTFAVTFAPASAGAASGSVNIASNASNPSLSIGLSGTGTAAQGQLAASPTSLSFGNVVVGSSKSLTTTLTASGGAVTISSDSSTSGQFALSGVSLPTTLSAGQSATFTVIFTPQTSGSASATASFTSNASNTPTAVTASGTGTPQHSVSLTWTDNDSSISGYNVYRSQQSSGPFTMINSSLVGPTSFLDNGVTAGQTYYYAVTAMNTQGVESVKTSPVSATIPTP